MMFAASLRTLVSRSSTSLYRSAGWENERLWCWRAVATATSARSSVAARLADASLAGLALAACSGAVVGGASWPAESGDQGAGVGARAACNGVLDGVGVAFAGSSGE